MTRTFRGEKAPRTSRDVERRSRLQQRLEDLYQRQDDLLASVQHYANFAGDQGTFDLCYQGELDAVNDEIAFLEARA